MTKQTIKIGHCGAFWLLHLEIFVNCMSQYSHFNTNFLKDKLIRKCEAPAIFKNNLNLLLHLFLT